MSNHAPNKLVIYDQKTYKLQDLIKSRGYPNSHIVNNTITMTDSIHETAFAISCLENVSAITCSLPSIYFISKWNYWINTIHLQCLLLKFGWVDKYLQDWWSNSIFKIDNYVMKNAIFCEAKSFVFCNVQTSYWTFVSKKWTPKWEIIALVTSSTNMHCWNNQYISLLLGYEINN